jgi:hypothetical protein
MLQEHGHGVEMVERLVEEALNLAGVQIHRDCAINTGGR